MKKLTCHCGAVEAEVNVPDKFEKVLRCNCSVCKRKGYVMSPIGENDMKITKGEDKLTLYQFYTNTAKHYFCSICGIFTHTRPCLLYTSPSPRDRVRSRMPSSA